MRERTYNRQPVQRPRMARSGLTDGLVTAIYPTSAFTALDVVTGAIGYATATADLVSSPAPNIDGNCAPAMQINNTSNDGGIAFGVQATLADQIVGKYSVFIEGGLSVDATTGIAFSSSEIGNGHGFFVGFDDASYDYNCVWMANEEDYRSFTGSASVGVNSELYSHRIMCTWTSSSARSIYTKGKETTGGSNNTQIGPAADVNRYTSIGSRRANSSTSDARARVSLALVWNRVLTLDEYVQLYQNPWQVFAPRSRQVYFDAAAVGGFKAAWSRNSNIILQPGVRV